MCSTESLKTFALILSITFFFFKPRALLMFLFLDNDCRLEPIPKYFNTPTLLPGENKCGVRRSMSERVVGGESVSICDFPWNVQMITEVEEGHAYCTGSIINERYVLTAAHCCIGEVSDITVVIGQSKFVFSKYSSLTPENCAIPSAMIGVDEYVVHPRYKADLWQSDDLALLRLSKIITFNDFFMPVCLPINGDNLSESDTNLIVSGWGLLSLTNLTQRAKDLQMVRTRVVRNMFCKVISAVMLRNLDENYVCINSTVTTETGRVGLAPGDSGGPTIKKLPENNRWYQIGVSSFISNESSGNIPDVLVRVSYYIPWIVNTMKP